MKFELKPFNRNIPKQEILKDLRNVATNLDQDSLSQVEYNKYGKYHSSTVSHKFGNWGKALEKAGLRVRKYQIIKEKEIIEDLRSVASKLKKDAITQAEYNAYGKYSAQAIINKFDTWFNGLEKASLKKTRNYGITNEEYLGNLLVIQLVLQCHPGLQVLRIELAGIFQSRFHSPFYIETEMTYKDYVTEIVELLLSRITCF